MNNRVPEGWKFGLFGDLAKVQNGYAFKSTEFSDTGYAAAIRMSNLKLGRVDLSDAKYVSQESIEGLDQFQLASGDFLFGMSGSLDNYAWVKKTDGICYLNQRVGCLRIKPKADPLYTSYCYLSGAVKDAIVGLAAGAAQLNISGNQLQEISILIPPLPEQQKIATILSSVDDVIEKTRAQIDKLKDLKTGMMQELLTKGIGHTEFKDSPMGRIPVSWSIVPIAEHVLEHRSGASLKPTDFSEEGFNVIPKKAIQFGGKLVRGEKTYCKKDYALSVKRSWVNKDFLVTVLRDLVPTGPSIGLIVEVEEEGDFLIAQGVYGFRLDGGLHHGYLAQLSNSDWFRKEMRTILVGSTQVHIRTGEFFDVLIARPPFAEQVEITNALLAIDKKIKLLNKKMSIFQSTKKALMQDLLTGKVRVNLTDKESAAV